MPEMKNFTSVARNVCKGDIYNEKQISKVKIGTKWVELRDDAGQLILRTLADQDVLVSREVPTQEEINNSRRQMANEELEYQVRNDKNKIVTVLEKLLAQAKEGKELTYWDIDRIIDAQMDTSVARRLQHIVSKNEDVDYVNAAGRMVAREMKSYNDDPSSRSTSAMHNYLYDKKKYTVMALAKGIGGSTHVISAEALNMLTADDSL